MTEIMPRFEHHAPATLDELLELLARHTPDVRVLAGGTDIVPQLRGGALGVGHLVSIGRVPGLDRIAWSDEEGLVIGAAARISDVGRHAAVRARYPGLAEACSVMATVQVRNMGTVAGNLANGSPCADTAASLLSHDARLGLASVAGRREVALRDFFLGPKQVMLGPDELLEEIRVPPPPPRCGAAYLRLSARSHVDMAAVTVAGLLALDESGQVDRARLALGAVGPTPLRCPDAEQILEDQVPDPALLEKAAEACSKAARPIDDVRASAAYRREMVRVLSRRVLEQCLENTAGVTP